jgi:hypothetical protein
MEDVDGPILLDAYIPVFISPVARNRSNDDDDNDNDFGDQGRDYYDGNEGEEFLNNEDANLVNDALNDEVVVIVPRKVATIFSTVTKRDTEEEIAKHSANFVVPEGWKR